MASTPPTPANLTCGHCGFVNEAERVYCHSCGSKLDRSILPQQDENSEDSPERARKRISKITNPKKGFVFQEVKTLFKIEIFAVLAAAVIQIAKPPDGIPEVKKESMQRLINSDMMEALQSPQPRSISFTEDEVNQHLKKQVKTHETMIPGIDAARTYVVFTPDIIRIGTEYSIFGYYSIYTEILFRVEIKEGKFSTPIVGGNLGRLQVDPRLMEYGDSLLFDSTWESLKRERGQMDRMSKVDVKKGEISLVTKGAGR
jgi:hypothetical protein